MRQLKHYQSYTLFSYIARQFLTGFLIIILSLLAIIYFFEILELTRRARGQEDIPFLELVQMGLMRLPYVGQKLFPFAILFSAMFTFWRMTRSQELIIARAAGLSVWQFTAPVMMATLAIGILLVTVINPVGAVMISSFDRLEDEILRGRAHTIDLEENGLWLRETLENGQYRIVHARNLEANTLNLKNVVLFHMRSDQFIERIDAPEVILFQGGEERSGYWHFPEAVVNAPGHATLLRENYRLPTDIRMTAIEESLTTARNAGFWALPKLIRAMDAAGFSSTNLRVAHQSLIALPLLLTALILIAASFSLRQHRRGGTLMMIALGIAGGFAFYLLTNVISTLGISGNIPVVLAAWAPVFITTLCGTAMLLYLEDG